ncbi:phosphomannomutase [Candidatus Magnetominusculus xianensis]|uniref:Phosphoglucomutase n=1 Tax=Candidatus Magnetominusculus xianensis TaxID=1748249 RepID=A0ABR5SHF2_9BACT|nr:phosphomannomutase [Candidatus Magnetominusculus xianensis]KWT91114.1 phosphoglucomutase [Candidatus Magnetominusculus xianensis]MBF0403241.1 phosphomannomutase [Nitrospirota bacterium]
MASFKDASECWKEILSNPKENVGLLSDIERFAKENTNPTNVVFGTSGWRGEIGLDYTFNNMKIVTEAIIAMFREEDPAVMEALGVKDLKEIQKRGVIVGHDNRFLGPDFAMTAIGLLNRAGIAAYYSGETTTPEFSSALEELGAAASINLTPSHNPARWAGYKFNPSDGGPAGPEITEVIEKFANKMMADRVIIPDAKAENYKTIDPVALYEKYINRKKTIDLDAIKKFIADNDVFICVDHVHGSTRGRPQRLLGDMGDKINYLRLENDYLFGGIAPEPSSKNMQMVTDELRASKAALTLGVIMDPDGDRIRFTDGTTELPMNAFGALAFHFFHTHKKLSGVVAKSVATSNFVNAIAEKLGVTLKETMVGFKNFRPFMLPSATERAIITFEESDGISGYNHTLEKDSMFGLLIAIEMMMLTGKTIGAYFKDVQEEFGYFYPDRSGVEVDRALVGKPLVEKLSKIKDTLTPGSSVTFGSKSKSVKNIITVDGTKVIFDDNSWLLIRPSGTEPKVRFYIETRSEDEKDIMFKKAEEITKAAISA